jgi:hypothetical protein
MWEAHLRKIQVFILRLFIDSESPSLLRGTVQAVPEGKPAAFQGEEALLAALRTSQGEMAVEKEAPAGKDQGTGVNAVKVNGPE